MSFGATAPSTTEEMSMIEQTNDLPPRYTDPSSREFTQDLEITANEKRSLFENYSTQPLSSSPGVGEVAYYEYRSIHSTKDSPGITTDMRWIFDLKTAREAILSGPQENARALQVVYVLGSLATNFQP